MDYNHRHITNIYSTYILLLYVDDCNPLECSIYKEIQSELYIVNIRGFKNSNIYIYIYIHIYIYIYIYIYIHIYCLFGKK